MASRLLTRIADGTAKVPITPECPFLPKMSFQFTFVHEPNPNSRFLLRASRTMTNGDILDSLFTRQWT